MNVITMTKRSTISKLGFFLSGIAIGYQMKEIMDTDEFKYLKSGIKAAFSKEDMIDVEIKDAKECTYEKKYTR